MSEFTMIVTVQVAEVSNIVTVKDALHLTLAEFASNFGIAVTITDDHSESVIAELCGAIDTTTGFLMSKARRDPAEREIVARLSECLRKYSPPSEE